MSGAMLDIDDDEIGLALVFAPSMALWAEVSADVTGLADECSEKTLAAIRKLVGIPARLSRMRKAQSTTLAVDPSQGSGLLRMKRTKATLGAHAEEEFASVLQFALAKHHDGTSPLQHRVVEVAVAVPKRVPVELNRLSVLRLEVIGTGNFSEVHKATVTSASVQRLAAVKMLKSGDSDARADLLREAALMALFQHVNILAQIGVVTVPRNMPALLVLEFCERGKCCALNLRWTEPPIELLVVVFWKNVSCDVRHVPKHCQSITLVTFPPEHIEVAVLLVTVPDLPKVQRSFRMF